MTAWKCYFYGLMIKADHCTERMASLFINSVKHSVTKDKVTLDNSWLICASIFQDEEFVIMEIVRNQTLSVLNDVKPLASPSHSRIGSY